MLWGVLEGGARAECAARVFMTGAVGTCGGYIELSGVAVGSLSFSLNCYPTRVTVILDHMAACYVLCKALSGNDTGRWGFEKHVTSCLRSLHLLCEY